ncbi:pectate lyase family protein [Streptomyces johnsoniae]|uniref:Right-handed parallel beta-helix repeat-containing protein n=1 Tax=Streptomyces johnsoniae TaxID=3075532 RepID=A0ABU2SD93_9ACTN|nr:right-handed parallel beta-helix repeat-containing protein [Streptomyces sp. DSM 41886]MDT0446942.1 right-handed parallel beta-helix repeat-containing protein [Streptomyces sp. DSM 41886]
MSRPLTARLCAVLTTTALAVTGLAVSATGASAAPAATAAATGYATQNGGTTGGAGGQTVRATTGTEINEALCNRASTSTPVIIEVEGTVNHGNTSDVSGDSCDVADDVIDLKEVSNVTIVGVGSGAVFDQLGIHIRDSSNIIIQNVTVRNVKKSGSPTSNGGDAISMESNVRNVWADHLTLEASGGEDEGFDGLFDMKNNTQYVTLSYSILRNSERGGLIGSSESDRSNGFVTFHHNLYQNLNSRTPLLRGGIAHMYNNHYAGLVESGINSRAGARAKVDNNYFEDSKDVLGTFYTDERGSWEVNDNIYDNVTWSSEGSENYPAGPDPRSNTTVSIPYGYSLDDAGCVPDVVSETAGADNGLQVSDGNCEAEPPDPTDPPDPPDPPDPTDPPVGTNLSIGAGADGSSKAGGTSYGNVIDGDMNTYWSPAGSTGRISVKWGSDTTVSTINIREAAGAEGNIGSWRVVNHDTGDALASGSGAGVITFPATSLSKINFEIASSSGTPRIAEFETYAGTPPDDGGPTEPPDDGEAMRFEAESSSATCDGTIDSDYAGYSGTGFCNTTNSTGAAAGFTIEAASAGPATLGVGFANGSTSARTADLVVNGSTVQSVSFEATGSWSTWSTKSLTAQLGSGTNTVRLVATGSGGLPNIDYLESSTGTPPDDGDDPPPTGDALYVAPGGSDGASGSESDPTTLTSAIGRIEPGGTIYMRGGTYNFSQTVHIEPGNDGTSGNRTELFASPGETPVLNFSAQSEDSANRGLAIGGDWWHLQGLVVERAGDNGILLGGNDNIIERVVTRHNRDTGLQLSRYTAGAPSSEWPSNNLIISSESHDNSDSDGEDADGFAPKLTVGPGNVFRYCVAHNNIDDGWDMFTKDDTGPIGAVTIEDSLSYENGTLSDGTQNSSGDRNGFKLGGEDIAVDHTVVRTIAFDNGKHGFTYNRNPGSMTIENNLSIGNEERNYNFDAGDSTFRNNTSCDSGSNDRIIGDDAGGNQWWSGSNGPGCAPYSGALDWNFASDGRLVVTIGGDTVNL